MATEHAPVQVETMLRIVADDGAWPLRTTLSYDSADPYAVRVRFHADTDDPDAVWMIARELLADGLCELVGQGDVRVWPWREATLALALCSDDGHTLFEVPRAPLARFLARTYAVVPQGRESAHIDVDAAVTRVLEEADRC